MWYAIISEDVKDSLPIRSRVRDAHLARMKTLLDEGRVLIAGPHPAIDSPDPGEAGFTGEVLLRSAFEPSELLVKDQSHLHAGHAGAQEGKGHFEVQIVSNAFSEMSTLQRHRAIFEALKDLMETDIHALQIRATAPPNAD